MENGKIEFNQEQVNSIIRQCYTIHSLGCLLELDRTGDDEREVVEALCNGSVSNVISNAARAIKQQVEAIITEIETIEHGKE